LATAFVNIPFIHYAPGARGDFLASILLDSWNLREFGAVRTPNYYKMHYSVSPWVTEQMFQSSCKIRIDDNNDINNIMQITFNHFLKNQPAVQGVMDDPLDHFYCTTKYMIQQTRLDLPILSEYDYWIDFSYLSDIQFISDFYYLVNRKPIDPDLIKSIEKNINEQVPWTSDPKLCSIALLIDFENRLGLLGRDKNFTLSDLISGDPKQLLKLQNYSKLM
jgi:hypothetical protein